MSSRGQAQAHPVAVPSGFFVLRTPLLPFTEVTAWGHGLQAPAAGEDPGVLAEAVAADRVQLRRRLEDIATTPEFRDSLFVASPSLAAAVDPWRKDPDSDKGRATERSLVSYLMRAAARPTPFGLFAGCMTGTIGARTRLRFEAMSRYRRHTRLDMDYLWNLAEAVERDPDLRGELEYRPTSSLYQVGDRLLFAEARSGQTGRSYRLVAVGITPYLMQTLARARDGAGCCGSPAATVTAGTFRCPARPWSGSTPTSPAGRTWPAPTAGPGGPIPAMTPMCSSPPGPAGGCSPPTYGGSCAVSPRGPGCRTT
jgi:hypothetical protein